MRLIVRLNQALRPGAKGVYDATGAALTRGAPAGRPVHMERDAAVKAAQDGRVEMLSPAGVQILAEAPPLKSRRAKPGYRTEDQKAE